MVLEAYTVVGDDPDMIINYIYENFMWYLYLRVLFLLILMLYYINLLD